MTLDEARKGRKKKTLYGHNNSEIGSNGSVLVMCVGLSVCKDSSFLPSIGVGEGVGAGEGDSVNWSSVPRFFPSRDLAMTI